MRFLLKKNDVDNSPDPLPRPPTAVESVITECGDKRTPLRTDVFAKEICKKCGVPEHSIVGFTKYSEIYRAEAQKRMLILDDDAIPPATKFSYTLPCPLAHPGLCAARDKDRLPVLHAIVKQAFLYLLTRLAGHFYHIRSIGSGPTAEHKVAWLMLSYSRLANPKDHTTTTTTTTTITTTITTTTTSTRTQ